MNKKPKVSVLMPAYNSQDYISDAIESILSQTYTDFEFVIIDDCSTDDTWKIIKKYAKNDKRIKAFKNVKNSGVTVSLNNGLEKCSGDYIARMDSDDVSLPKRLEKQVEVLENGKADVVGTNIYFIDEQGKVFGKRKYEPVTGKIIKLESPLAHPTVVFKKELVDKYGGYEPIFNSAEDYDLWLRFWQNNAKIKILNSYLLKYRQHRNTIKQTRTKKTIKTTIRVKLNAWKRYNFKLGVRGWTRLLMEAVVLILPKEIILRIFYFFKKKSNN